MAQNKAWKNLVASNISHLQIEGDNCLTVRAILGIVYIMENSKIGIWYSSDAAALHVHLN